MKRHEIADELFDAVAEVVHRGAKESPEGLSQDLDIHTVQLNSTGDSFVGDLGRVTLDIEGTDKEGHEFNAKVDLNCHLKKIEHVMEGEVIKESHELVTPVLCGTPDERIEALNMWTALVTTLKKMSELPSTENRVALLRCASRQASCDLDRITNVMPIPTPTPMALPAPTAESLQVEERQQRLLELAGVTTKKF